MQHAACSFTKIIFQINKRLSTILARQLLVASVALAQSQFTGKVVSQEDGEPVIGASVRVAGTKVGTVTYALKARVCMHMANYPDAEEAAKKAISIKGNGDGTYTDMAPNNETYLIPASEINAGFMKDQNTGREDGLPVRD